MYKCQSYLLSESIYHKAKKLINHIQIVILFVTFLKITCSLLFLGYSSPVISDAKLTALGPEQTRVAEHRQVVMCILCQEEQEVKVDSRAMVLAAFVQRSTVLSKNRNKIISDPGK